MKTKGKKLRRRDAVTQFYRPTYLGIPFQFVFLAWLAISIGLTVAATSASSDPFSTFFTSLLIMLFSNLVFLQGPDFDPTAKFSLYNGILRKHSWFHKTPKAVAIQDIATLQNSVWSTAYVYKVQIANGKTVFRIPESKGTEELMKYLEKSLKKWQQQHRI